METFTEWLYVYSSKFLISVRASMASRFRRSIPFISLTVWSQLAPSGILPLRTSFSAWTTTSMALP